MIPANYVEAAEEGAKGGRARSSTLPRDASGQLLVSGNIIVDLVLTSWQPMPWFHGKITRELAEQLLQPRTDGLFLIRESTNFPGDYTLCVWCDIVVMTALS